MSALAQAQVADIEEPRVDRHGRKVGATEDVGVIGIELAHALPEHAHSQIDLQGLYRRPRMFDKAGGHALATSASVARLILTRN